MESEVSQSSGGDMKALLTHGFAFFLGWVFAPDRTPKKLLERDGLAYLKRVVKEWRPVNCENESDCQIALQNYLLGRFSQDRLLVEPQYGAGPSRVDLVVEREYGIEIKYGLKDESEVKRLVGQIAEMKDHFEGILVVACGDTKPEIEVRLERELGGPEDQRSNLPWAGASDPVELDFITVPVIRQGK